MIERRRLLAAACATACSAPLASLLAVLPMRSARAETIDFAGREPQAADIVRALREQHRMAPAAAGAPLARPLPRTRSLKLEPTAPPATAAPGATAAASSDKGAQALASSASPKLSFDQIRFDYDSARLRPESRHTLDEIGRALASAELAELSFIVEGHTDARGGFAYNIHLSRKRAASVRSYLATRHGIDEDRLEATGKGPTELLDAKNPESPVNRRVALVAYKPRKPNAG